MTSSLPMVSVVIPTRDRAALLKRAMAAVLSQDYLGEIECVVVFDRSPAELPAHQPIAPRRRLRVISNRRTPGLAGARNTGIVAARGQLVAHCDDDDEWLPAKLSTQVTDLAGTPECSVATTGIITVTGRRCRDRVFPQRRITHGMLLRSRIMEAHSSTLLIRRETYDRVGLVDERIPHSYAEDYEWLLRASADGPILVTPRPLVRVDMNPHSHFSRQWTSVVDANHYLIRRHPDLAGDAAGLARICGRLAIAEAALGHRKRACRYAARSLRLQPLQLRAFVALAISSGLLRADVALRIANAFGRGI